MTELTIIQRSPDPEQVAAQSRTRRSIAEKIRAMGQNRIGALILLHRDRSRRSSGRTCQSVSYETFWETHLTVGVGDLQLDFTLHALVNDALMAIFFFTVGLEVRREFAIGELTSWSRAIVPVVAAIAGLAIPALLFVLDRAGSGHEYAWGIVISTDTAFLVGALALIGPRVPGRLRVFLLALAVVDDIGALSIIALVYTENFNPLPLLIAAVGLVGVYFTRYLRGGRGPVYATLAVIVWLGVPGLGRAPHARRRRDRAARAGVPARPPRRGARARPRPHFPAVPQHRIRPRRREQPARVDLDQRAAAVGLRAVRRVRDPAAVRPGQRRASCSTPRSWPARWRSPLTWGIVVGLVVGKFIGVFGVHAPSCGCCAWASSARA